MIATDEEFSARAALTIGADGLHSFVARQVDAPFERVGRHASACVYAYWADLDVDGYEWFWRAGTMIGLIPTNDDEVCVCICAPLDRLRATGYGELIDAVAPEVADAIDDCGQTEPAAALPAVHPDTCAGRPGRDGPSSAMPATTRTH